MTNTVKNVEAFTSTLAENKDNVGAVIKDAKELTTRFKTVADKLETALEDLSGFTSSGGDLSLNKRGSPSNRFGIWRTN